MHAAQVGQAREDPAMSYVVYQGRRLQRGHGIGGIFRALSRTLIPLGKKLLSSGAAKSVGRVARDEAIRVGSQTLADALAGENVGRALKHSVDASRDRLSKKVRLAGEAAAPLHAPPKKRSKGSKHRDRHRHRRGSKLKRGRPLF